MARFPDGWVFIPKVSGPKVKDGKCYADVSVESRELVMCKNCIYYRENNHDRGDDSRCAYWNHETRWDDYCSRAIRRPDDG